MEWWQIVLVLLASVVVGTGIGALFTYLTSRFFKKRRAGFLVSDPISLSARRPEVAEASVAPMEAGDDEFYQGRVELEITGPTPDFAQMLQLRTYLREVPDLRLLSVGGSADGGTSIVVFVDKPLRLLSILSEMPLAKEVFKKRQNIELVL